MMYFFLALSLPYLLTIKHDIKHENPCRLGKIPAPAEAEQFLLPTLRGFAAHYSQHFMGLTPLRALFEYGDINMIFMIYYKSAK
jgi:hypothetical protein